MDGVQLGKLRELKLLRTTPKQVSSAEITVRLDSAAYADRLSACTLRIDDVENIDERTTFVCVTADNPGIAGAFERFGEVRVEGTDLVLPLLLPAAAVQDFRSQGADSAAAEAEAAVQAAESAAVSPIAPPAPVPAVPQVRTTPAPALRYRTPVPRVILRLFARPAMGRALCVSHPQPRNHACC